MERNSYSSHLQGSPFHWPPCSTPKRNRRFTVRHIVALLGWVCGWLCFTSAAIAQQEATQEAKEIPARPAATDEPELSPSSDFLRVSKDGKGVPIALETSITHYVGKNEAGEDVSVDLIGVVHIGEEDYYQALNHRFEDYDAVLYELVAPEGTRIPKGGERAQGFNPVSGLQQMMKRMLKLEFQLEHIDYTKENLIHADMSPEEFAESMQANDESLARIFFKMLGQSMAMKGSANASSETAMLSAAFSQDPTMRLRSLMAGQMQEMEVAMTMFEGKDGSTIITHRNRKALEVLQREIKEGKTKLAVFYGAGHLPDMEMRLERDFHLKQQDKHWFTAWRLRNSKSRSSSKDDDR